MGAVGKGEMSVGGPVDVRGIEVLVLRSEMKAGVGFIRGTGLTQSWLDVDRMAALRFVKDERLRQAMSFHALLIGGNPFETTSIYSLIPFLERKWGVHFPIGGTGALVRGLCDLATGQGATIRSPASPPGSAREP